MSKYYKTALDFNNSTSNQRERILNRFAHNPKLSTMEARNKLGVLHLPGRILELRRQGHNILTYWGNEPDANGAMHRVGQYFYLGKKKEADNNEQ